MGIGRFVGQGVTMLRQSSDEMWQSVMAEGQKAWEKLPVEHWRLQSQKAMEVASNMAKGRGDAVSFSVSARDVRHVPVVSIVARLLETRDIHRQSKELTPELKVLYGTGERINENLAKVAGKAFLFYWFCLGKKRWFRRFIIADLMTSACSWAFQSSSALGFKEDEKLGRLYVRADQEMQIIDPRLHCTLTPSGRAVDVTGQETVFALALTPKKEVEFPPAVYWAQNWDKCLEEEGELTARHLVGADWEMLKELAGEAFIQKAPSKGYIEVGAKQLFPEGNSRLSLDELHSMLTGAGLKDEWDRVIKELGESLQEKEEDSADGESTEDAGPAHIKELMQLLGYADNTAAESIIDSVEAFANMVEVGAGTAGIIKPEELTKLKEQKEELYGLLRSLPEWALTAGVNLGRKALHEAQGRAGNVLDRVAQTIQDLPTRLADVKGQCLAVLDVVDARVTEDGEVKLLESDRAFIDTRRGQLKKLVSPAKLALQAADPEKLAMGAVEGACALANRVGLALEDRKKKLALEAGESSALVESKSAPERGPASQEISEHFKPLLDRIKEIVDQEQAKEEVDAVEITGEGGTVIVKDEERHPLAAKLEGALGVVRDLNEAVLEGDGNRQDFLGLLVNAVTATAVDGVATAANLVGAAARGLQEGATAPAVAAITDGTAGRENSLKAVARQLFSGDGSSSDEDNSSDNSWQQVGNGIPAPAVGVEVEDVTAEFLEQQVEQAGGVLSAAMQELLPPEQQGAVMAMAEQLQARAANFQANPAAAVYAVLSQVPGHVVQEALEGVAGAQATVGSAVLGATQVVKAIPNGAITHTLELVDKARKGNKEAIEKLAEGFKRVVGLEGPDGTPAVEDGDTAMAPIQQTIAAAAGAVKEYENYRQQGLAILGQAEGMIGQFDSETVEAMINTQMGDAGKQVKEVTARARELLDKVSEQYLEKLSGAAAAFLPAGHGQRARKVIAPVAFKAKDFKSSTVSIHRLQAQLVVAYRDKKDIRLLTLIELLQRSFAKIRVGEELSVQVDGSKYAANFPGDWSEKQKRVYTALFNQVSGLPEAKVALKMPLGTFFNQAIQREMQREEEQKRRRERA